MDFESYIGKEKQLLARIERERAEMNSHEPDAWRGNYELAADEIKLLRAGDYVKGAAEMAADAIVALDERMAQLKRAEGEVNAKNTAFLKRVAEFDARYAEVTAALSKEAAALQARDAELTKRIETAQQALLDLGRGAEKTLREVSGKSEKGVRETAERTDLSLRQASERAEGRIREMSEATEANLKDISQATRTEVDQLVSSLKAAQAEFEASINEKLEQDKQTLEKIKFMISTMSDIIKT